MVARAIELRLLVLVLPVESDFDRFCSFGVLQKIVATRSKIDIVFIIRSFSDSSEREYADKLGCYTPLFRVVKFYVSSLINTRRQLLAP